MTCTVGFRAQMKQKKVNTAARCTTHTLKHQMTVNLQWDDDKALQQGEQKNVSKNNLFTFLQFDTL